MLLLFLLLALARGAVPFTDKSREMEAVFSVEPWMAQALVLSDRFVAINNAIEDGIAKAPFAFDFKAKSFVDVNRTVNKLDTAAGDFSSHSFVVRERTNQPAGPRDIVLKFVNPFKAVCAATVLEVTSTYENEAEEKVEQDCSLPWEAYGTLEAYSVGFQRSLKVSNLPLTVKLNTVGYLAKIFKNIASLTNTEPTTSVFQLPGRCEWVRKFPATLGTMQVSIFFVRSYQTCADIRDGVLPLDVQVEFKPALEATPDDLKNALWLLNEYQRAFAALGARAKI